MITTLFLDIGGVLLTNGWDRQSSCFVHFRKPDTDIYRVALDVAQVKPAEVVYVDDRPMFVDVAESLGIHGIHHTDYAATRAALETLGLGPAR